jgi:hypothetical protein
MPLKKGYSRETISQNISELMNRANVTHDQAIAIALESARESAEKAGRKPARLFSQRALQKARLRG